MPLTVSGGGRRGSREVNCVYLKVEWRREGESRGCTEGRRYLLTARGGGGRSSKGRKVRRRRKIEKQKQQGAEDEERKQKKRSKRRKKEIYGEGSGG